MRNTVLFDLGGTLVHYFERYEFPGILKQAITDVHNYLLQRDILRVSPEVMWRKVREEDYESSDYRIRPLEDRLVRIFQLDNLAQLGDLITTMCRCFMKPIFARGHCYEDTIPTLKGLKSRGFKMAIVSNTTWGSPASLWREEVERLGLSAYMDAVVFCRDVGWRKPAKQIFEFVLKKLQAFPQQCIFVGDDPRWDLVGPRTIGIEPILIDRRGMLQHVEEKPMSIRNLNELLNKLQLV